MVVAESDYLRRICRCSSLSGFVVKWFVSFSVVLVAISQVHGGIISPVLKVPVLQSKVIRVEGLKRISLTNPSIADIVIASPSEVIVNGKETGRTTLHLWDVKGRVDLSLVVYNDRKSICAMLEKDVKDVLSIDTVKVSLSGENNLETIVLRGLVSNDLKREIIEEMAKAYTDGPVLNLLQVEYTTLSSADIEDRIRLLVKEPEVKIRVIKEGSELRHSSDTASVSSILLEGFVDDEYDKQRVVTICEAFVKDKDRISDLIDVVNPVKILVEATVLELAAGDTESLGVEWGTAENTLVSGGILTMGERAPNSARFLENLFNSYHGDVSYLGPKVDASNNWPWSLDNLNRVDPLYSKINFSLQNNKGRVLARPSVVAKVGSEALLRVGGEFPLIGETRNQGVNVEYKPYGLDLKITPEIDHKGNITAVFDMSWTTIDFASAQTRNNAVYYGLKERSTATSVTVRDGQHIIISGLTTEDKARVSSGIPFLSKIPIIGKLFENNDYIDRKTELIIVLTPSLYSSKKIRDKFKSMKEEQNSSMAGQSPENTDPLSSIPVEQISALNIAMKRVDETFSSIMGRDDITLTPVDVSPVKLAPDSSVQSRLCNKIASCAFKPLQIRTVASPSDSNQSTVSSPVNTNRVDSIGASSFIVGKGKSENFAGSAEGSDSDISSVVMDKIDSLVSNIENCLSSAF